MNLILLREKDFLSADRVVIRGRRLRHVREVLRSTAGDILSVGQLNGALGKGTITAIDSRALEMEVELGQAPPPAHPATLIMALPRPIVLKRVLAAVSSLGVKTIYLIHSRRVEKSFWGSPVLSPERITEQLCLGLEQAKDTVVPEVHLKKRFKPFVEDELPAIIKNRNAFVAHPEAETPLSVPVNGPLLLMVGPEGGFIDYEIKLLQRAGVRPFSAGKRILRVETAVPFLLARLGQI
jgi:RsmE family RNA methyltransferase